MKSKSIICMLLLSMMLGMSTTSCEDMLSPDSERHSYTVAEDTLYSYWGILKSLQNVAERYVILNECRGDLVDRGIVSDTIAPILDFGMNASSEKYKDGACAYLRISDYYHIINSCNAYIAMCDTNLTTGTNRKYMIKEYAQVQAIRAWVYIQLFYAYGPNRVPFYTEPMLTTDDINNFTAGGNYPKITPEALVEGLGPDLEKMEQVERTYGYPEYLNYGDADPANGHYVCHSSRCMFPVSIVLGDLYLLKASASQSQADYMKAATHYYNFLNSKYGGPLSAENYISYGLLDDKRDNPLYSYSMLPVSGFSVYDPDDNPFTESGAASRELESITCIPSNAGKLEGKVLTDISRLFGFEAQMRTSGGESANASVGLTRNYERQLIPSRGYEALCDSQKFEIYVGWYSESNGYVSFSTDTIETIPGVGDARRAWIYEYNGLQWTFRAGDDLLYGKMVSKQNPSGIFTQTYPVVYRKSTVWLRFAEALNGAGFPSYAFAVLKTGICSHPEWFPTDPATEYNSLNLNRKQWYALNGFYNSPYDYMVSDTVYCYVDAATGDTIPAVGSCDTLLELIDAVTSYFQAEYEASQETDTPMAEPRALFDANGNLTAEARTNFRWAPKDANSFSNEPVYINSAFTYNNLACYYLDRREVANAVNHPEFMDFNQPYLEGLSRTVRVPFKEQGKLLVTDTRLEPYSSIIPGNYTIGVHQRGCGLRYYNDPYYYRSSYNYVDQVAKKIKRDVTSEEIYSGTIDEEVREAVEDLIIDEMALELAFEGSRFSDLCRVSLHRGPEYLAKRVAMRDGRPEENVMSSPLYRYLTDMNHWWLPIPEE